MIKTVARILLLPLCIASIAAADQPPIDARAALLELAETVRTRHAYATLRGVDLDAAIERELARLGPAPARDEVILAAQRIVCTLGDGHAEIDDWEDAAPPGRATYLLEEAGRGIVCFRGDRDGLLVSGHPYVIVIDGVPIERWIEAASVFVPAGSPHMRRSRAIRLLRYVNLVRDELGLSTAVGPQLRLQMADGENWRTLSLPLAQRRRIYGSWPRRGPAVLDSGFGYLRLPSMSLGRDGQQRLDLVRDTLGSMLQTPGLIIDVRGNGGGSRHFLRLLLPYFMPPETPSRVVNVAIKRLEAGENPNDPDGHLADRFAYPANWPGWTHDERAAITVFDASFTPQWQPTAGNFSARHYMVVSRAETPYFDKPVVILMDELCFSATDIFLGAFKGLPTVTLMGEPSAGGSARSQKYRLEVLDTEVRLATMVSYSPDGRLYDGNGIAPDVLVDRDATDVFGETDAQLDAAVRRLQQK